MMYFRDSRVWPFFGDGFGLICSYLHSAGASHDGRVLHVTALIACNHWPDTHIAFIYFPAQIDTSQSSECTQRCQYLIF
jgi:hypothetical protein